LLSLVAAWKPDGDLRMLELIVDGALECDAAADVEPVLATLGEREIDDGLAAKIAELHLASGDHEAALKAVDGRTGKCGVTKVKILLAQDRPDEAKAVYDKLVRANPTLEDPEITSRIEMATAESDERPRALNVVSIADHWKSGGQDKGDGPAQIVDTRLDYSGREGMIRFADIGGLEDVKKQIHRKIITPFEKPSLYQKFRRKAGGGVLLFGPPGCGKTMLARATAGECNARFLNVPIIEILDMYVGESEKRLAAVFADARRETPCVLFFDELEALAARRHHAIGETKASLVSTFLSELDGFEANNEGVLILAATNMPWSVDPAFRRPGRFDRVQFVPPPDKVARQEILRLQLEDRPGAETIDTAFLAEKTSAYSGADLQNIVNSAIDIAIEESLEGGEEAPLTMEHFREAFDEVRPTTLEWLTTARNYAKYSNTGGQYDDVARFLESHGQ
jgi:AAA+ superfamily predicted ATPase